GKTVLLTSWAQACPQGLVAWLSLEEADDIQDRFWPLVATALNADIAGEPLGPDTRADGDGWVNLLLGSISESPPRVLIIDDFHLITDRTILRSLGRLVESAPSHLRLVLVGQHASSLMTASLVRPGTATVIAERDLRFMVEELAALIALA